MLFESRGRIYGGYCWTAYLSTPEEEAGEDAEEVVWAYAGSTEEVDAKQKTRKRPKKIRP